MLQEIDIQECARQLLESHGDKAIAVAAQRARSFEVKGKRDEAKTWRHVEDALKPKAELSYHARSAKTKPRDIALGFCMRSQGLCVQRRGFPLPAPAEQT
jgi:hypothetical protein